MNVITVKGVLTHFLNIKASKMVKKTNTRFFSKRKNALVDLVVILEAKNFSITDIIVLSC